MSEKYLERVLRLPDPKWREIDTDALNHQLKHLGLTTHINGKGLYVHTPLKAASSIEDMRPGEDLNVQIAEFDAQVRILNADYGCEGVYPPMDENPLILEDVYYRNVERHEFRPIVEV